MNRSLNLENSLHSPARPRSLQGSGRHCCRKPQKEVPAGLCRGGASGLRLHLAGTNGGPREPHEMESASKTQSPASTNLGVRGSRTAKRAPKQFRLGTGGRDTVSEGRLLGGGAPGQEARRNLCVGAGRGERHAQGGDIQSQTAWA